MQLIKTIISLLLILSFFSATLLIKPQKTQADFFSSLGKGIGGILNFMANPSGTALQAATAAFGEKSNDMSVLESLGFDFVKSSIEAAGEVLREQIYRRQRDKLLSWIRNDGKPIEDWKATLTDAAKTATGETLNQFLGLQIDQNIDLCSPLGFNDQDDAFANLYLELSKVNQPQKYNGCKIDEAYNNLEDFYNQFTGGCREINGKEVCEEFPWDTWVKVTGDPRYNYNGTYLMLLDQIATNQAASLNAKSLEMQSGLGFLGTRKCTAWEDNSGVTIYLNDSPNNQNIISQKIEESLGENILVALQNPQFKEAIYKAPSQPEEYLPILGFSCSRYKTLSPGSLVADIAAKTIYGDLEHNDDSGAGILKGLIKDITNSLIFRFTEEGLYGIGDDAETEIQTEEFNLTGYEEWLGIKDSSAGKDLIQKYETAIVETNKKIDSYSNSIANLLQIPDPASEPYLWQERTNKGLNDLENCVISVCLEEQKNRCDALYGEEYALAACPDQAAIQNEINLCLAKVRAFEPVEEAELEACATLYVGRKECLVDNGYSGCVESRRFYCSQQNPEVVDITKERKGFEAYYYKNLDSSSRDVIDSQAEQLKNLAKSLQDKFNSLIDLYMSSLSADGKTYASTEILINELNLIEDQNQDKISRGAEEEVIDTKNLQNALEKRETKIDKSISSIEENIAEIEKIEADKSLAIFSQWLDLNFLKEKIVEIYGPSKDSSAFKNGERGKYHRYIFNGETVLSDEITDENGAITYTCANFEKRRDQTPECQQYPLKFGDRCVPTPEGVGKK